MAQSIECDESAIKSLFVSDDKIIFETLCILNREILDNLQEEFGCDWYEIEPGENSMKITLSSD